MSTTRFLGAMSLAAVVAWTPLGSNILQAQTGPIVQGMRVRIHTVAQPRGVYWIGAIQSLGGDTLVVELDPDRRSVAVPNRWIEEMRISEGIGHAGRTTTGIGAFAGLVAGALIGMVTYKDVTCPAPQTPNELFCDDTSPRLGRAALGGLLGAGLGAGMGFFVGTRVPRERRRAIDSPWQTPMNGATRPAVVVGATVAFRLYGI